jgi:homocitrate synthase NifV
MDIRYDNPPPWEEAGGGLRIIDTTLRDGEQAPGVCFPPDIKIEILKMLYDAGIRDFEIGTPAVSGEEQEAICRMLLLNLDANLSVWCRANLDDLQTAARLGARMVNLSLPVSDIQLKAIGKDRKWVFSQLKTCLEFASMNFDFVTVGAQDASRADKCMLKDYINVAKALPVVKRIRLADTVGILNPFTVHDLVGKMVEEFPNAEFEFHGHNDLGMATANTLAAIVAGATVVSCTVNGLGERCGNAPLEEVVMALEYSWSTKLTINKPRLQSVCNTISMLTGRKISVSKPFSGELCFSHESGIHTRSLSIDPLAYQPFHPEDIGRKMKFIYGKHSGSGAIRSLLESKRLFFTDPIVETILSEIKLKTRYSSSGFSDDDVLNIYHHHFSSCVEPGSPFCTENGSTKLNSPTI